MQGEVCFLTTPEGSVAGEDRLLILASRQQIVDAVQQFIQAHKAPSNIFLATDLDPDAGKELLAYFRGRIKIRTLAVWLTPQCLFFIVGGPFSCEFSICAPGYLGLGLLAITSRQPDSAATSLMC